MITITIRAWLWHLRRARQKRAAQREAAMRRHPAGKQIGRDS